MKLNYIKFNDHKVLGNLEIDFCINGKPVSTIFIAGENGTGKTTLLDSIYKLANLQPNSVLEGEGITYGLTLSEQQIEAVSKHPNVNVPGGGLINELIEVQLKPEGRQDWSRIIISGTEDVHNITLPSHLFSDEEFKKEFRFLYSNVEINFNPQNIKSVTSKNIDEITTSQTTNKNTATEITQLLIDIQSLDDADLSKWTRENRGKPAGDDILDKRIRRFQKAFSKMFPNKKYKEIINHNSHKKVIFSENGKECFIEDLSSGEKQIVFRGGFFLKDTGSINGALSIIDEPEISLHPSWQLKIMDYYKSILGIEDCKNQEQLIVATHSPFILHNYNRANDKIIVLNTLESGEIEVSQEPSFYGWSHEQAIQEAFSLSIDPAIKTPLILVEGETDEKYLNAAANILGVDLKGTEIKWVGRLNERGNAEFTGDKALNQTLAFAKANPDTVNRPLILLYDSDTNKSESEHGNIYVRAMPFINDRIMKKGIENLLNLPETLDISDYYDVRDKTDEYGATSTIKSLNKNKLCDYLIEGSLRGDFVHIFRDFSDLFCRIDNAVESLKNC